MNKRQWQNLEIMTNKSRLMEDASNNQGSNIKEEIDTLIFTAIKKLGKTVKDQAL